MKGLRWDPALRRWRNDSGRLLNLNQQTVVRNELADLFSAYLREETALFLSGKLEYANWVKNSENYVLQATSNGYSFGRGGVANMTNGDYDRLARTLNTQVDLWRNFAAEVETGNLSMAQILARADSYGGSVVYAHEQAVNQAAVGEDASADWELPFYPGDGNTECLSRCRCAWSIDEDEYGWTCIYYTMEDEAVCPTCNRRENQHGPDSPLMFPKAGAPARIRDLEAA